MKQLLYLGLFVLFVTVALLIARPTASCYAPPRTEDTVPPFVEPSIDQAPTDSQSEVFKDAGGWINQREHPLSSNFQENAFLRTDYGGFGPYVSDIGTVLSENLTGTEAGTSNVNPETCPRSVIVTNDNQRHGPGLYNINKDWYAVKVYPPLRVLATGPDGERQEMNYTSNVLCPSWTWFTLDTQKVYNTLTLSSNTYEESCPHSLIVTEDMKSHGPGVYTIDKSWYNMKVYPPLHIIATGPNGTRQEMTYPTDESCPSWIRLTLDNEETYTTLMVSSDTTLKQQNVPNTDKAVEQRANYLLNFEPYSAGFGTEFTSPQEQSVS